MQHKTFRAPKPEWNSEITSFFLLGESLIELPRQSAFKMAFSLGWNDAFLCSSSMIRAMDTEGDALLAQRQIWGLLKPVDQGGGLELSIVYCVARWIDFQSSAVCRGEVNWNIMMMREGCSSIFEDTGCHVCGISRWLKLDCQQIPCSHISLLF